MKNFIPENSFILNKETLESSLDASVIYSIYSNLADLSYLYPNFESWYTDKVVPGIFTGERTILIEIKEKKIAGIAILKDSHNEKKLCCLRVMPEFQKSTGLGVKLFSRSMDILETEKPVLSVGQSRIEYFNKIFNYFGYKKIEEYPDYYKLNQTELSFNGLLNSQVPLNIESSKNHLILNNYRDSSFRFMTPLANVAN